MVGAVEAARHVSRALRPLVLIGAGGLAREVAEAVHAVNSLGARWRLMAVFDDAEHLLGMRVAGVRVLGPVEAVRDVPDAQVVVCVASPDEPRRRQRLVARLELADDRFATVVHPSASLAGSTRLGPGSVVLALSVTTADVTIGSHGVVMPGTVLTHDDVVGDCCTFGAGARLGGAVVVGDGAYVGSSAAVRESCRIGAGALVGMGAVVTRDIPPDEVWAGVPARRIASAGARLAPVC